MEMDVSNPKHNISERKRKKRMEKVMHDVEYERVIRICSVCGLETNSFSTASSHKYRHRRGRSMRKEHTHCSNGDWRQIVRKECTLAMSRTEV